MAQTTILAAGTTAANSSTVTVGTTPVKVSIFTDANKMPRCKLPLQEQAPTGSWQNYYGENVRFDERQPVYLTNTRRSFTITAPGSYRLVRSVESANVGAISEDGT